MDNKQNGGAVSPELDSMVCDLIGYMLDELADGRDPGVAVCVEDTGTGRAEAVFSDDGEEACLEAAQEFVCKRVHGSASENLGPIDRYAYACTGAVQLDGAYQDAVLVSFYERALPSAYSAYVAFGNQGGGDEFVWSEPEPAGEEVPLI